MALFSTSSRQELIFGVTDCSPRLYGVKKTSKKKVREANCLRSEELGKNMSLRKLKIESIKCLEVFIAAAREDSVFFSDEIMSRF